MSKKQRRKFSGDFKLKVILEALRERSTLTELSQKHDLHANQISNWKGDFLEKAKSVMDSKSSRQAVGGHEKELQRLYAKIGRLQMENDFLKKKFQG